MTSLRHGERGAGAVTRAGTAGNGRSGAARARAAALVVAVAGGLAACEGTNALDAAAPAAFVVRSAGVGIGDTATLRRQTIGLDACLPAVLDGLDSSTTVTLEGAPRLQLALPAGFRVVSAALPTPTMQRIDGPDGERILVERDPRTVVAWGPAYAAVTRTSGRLCWLAAPTRVQAQVLSFVPRVAPGPGPVAIVAAAANVPTAIVGGAPLSLAVYARTPARRTQLLALVARLRPVP